MWKECQIYVKIEIEINKNLDLGTIMSIGKKI